VANPQYTLPRNHINHLVRYDRHYTEENSMTLTQARGVYLDVVDAMEEDGQNEACIDAEMERLCGE